MDNQVTSLPINLDNFGFVTRETVAGKPLPFRCGRDFLYYALHFYRPSQCNKATGGAAALERTLWGRRMPTSFTWTQVHVAHLPKLLRRHGLQLLINNCPIDSWWTLMRHLLTPSTVTRETLDRQVATAIANKQVIGIDISIKWFGLVDHVMFVYGYDDTHFYVIDTQQLPYFESEKVLDGERFLMKLPKAAIYERLRPISRIWQVVPRET